jgi:hypothetical protein
MTAWRHARAVAIWCEACQKRHKNGFYGCPKLKRKDNFNSPGDSKP